MLEISVETLGWRPIGHLQNRNWDTRTFPDVYKQERQSFFRCFNLMICLKGSQSLCSVWLSCFWLRTGPTRQSSVPTLNPKQPIFFFFYFLFRCTLWNIVVSSKVNPNEASSCLNTKQIIPIRFNDRWFQFYEVGSSIAKNFNSGKMQRGAL